MDDIDYGTLFGIDAEAPAGGTPNPYGGKAADGFAGAEVTEPAEPSADTTAQGANEQELAEPAAAEEQEETTTEGAEGAGQSGDRVLPVPVGNHRQLRRGGEAEDLVAIQDGLSPCIQVKGQQTLMGLYPEAGEVVD